MKHLKIAVLTVDYDYLTNGELAEALAYLCARPKSLMCVPLGDARRSGRISEPPAESSIGS